MRKLFNIPAERETRLWNKYMNNSYEQLSKLDNTVQDAGLYQGQVGGPGRALAGSAAQGAWHVGGEVIRTPLTLMCCSFSLRC